MDTYIQKGPTSRRSEFSSFDAVVLGVLFCFVLVPRLQDVFVWIDQFKIREVLYLIMYVKLGLFTNIRYIRKEEKAILVFLMLTAWIGLNTWLRYGSEMALVGYVRFMNCALLAPLVARANLNERHLRGILSLWVIMLVGSAGTLLYQLNGGSMEWLSKGMRANRGGLDRYVSLMGFNVDAICAGAALPFLFLGQRNVLLRIGATPFLIALVVLSLSRSGVCGLALSVLLALVLSTKYRNVRRGLSNAVKVMIVVAGMVGLVMLADLPRLRDAVDVRRLSSFKEYVMLAPTLISGTGGRIGRSDRGDGVVGDLLYRHDKTVAALERTKDEPFWSPLDVIFGSSFGVAGSAARDIRNIGLGPEGSWSTMFMFGGLALVASFVWLWGQTLWWLWGYNLDSGLGQSCAIGFLVVSVFLITYAVVYDPGTAAYLWLLVGGAANPHMRKLGRTTNRDTQI